MGVAIGSRLREVRGDNMIFYYAVSGRTVKSGGMLELCHWAQDRIANNKAKIVKILKARPGERTARIVLEVTREGIAETRHGRVMLLSVLKKAEQKNG